MSDAMDKRERLHSMTICYIQISNFLDNNVCFILFNCFHWFAFLHDFLRSGCHEKRRNSLFFFHG